MVNKKVKPEILAPVGSYESLYAAINAGADSVYFGVGSLNMRAHAAKKLSIKDLNKIVRICSEKNVKCYLTINSVIYDEDIKKMHELCDAAKKACVNGIIATDIAVMLYARKIGLNVHASTQLNISNIEAVKYFSQFVDVIVLARELSLNQVKDICSQIKNNNIKGPSGELVKIEVFVHGALCVSISGKCYMSLAQYAKSANRGECLHACRRAYTVIDEETGDKLKIDNKYVMSPKDLCTINIIDRLIDAGVSIFKIEGRGRSPDYVDVVVRCYKDAIKYCILNKYDKEKKQGLYDKLKTVFNRGFWDNGYYLGKRMGEWHDHYGSKATIEKHSVGKVLNYFCKPKIAEIEIQSGELKKGDEILIVGPTTGVLRLKADKIIKDNEELNYAKKGDCITIVVFSKSRKNDKVYVLKERKIC